MSTSPKKLLLIIDLQQGWRHADATEAAMLHTVALCKEFPGDVIHCRFKNDPASLFYSQLNWERFSDPSDTNEIPEIARLKLPTYWRSTYSCINDETLPLIRKYSDVYIAGVFTDISVFSTALAIFDLNIPVFVVTDCVASLHGNAAHQAALQALNFAIGVKFLIKSSDITC